MIASSTIQRASEANDVLDLADLSEVGVFMNRVFAPVEDTRSPVDHRGNEGPHDDKALILEGDQVDVLLSKASKAIEFLAARCAILEQELADKEDLATEHEQAAKQWKHFAVKLQAQTADDQNTIAEITARCDAAEVSVASLEAAAAEARHRSAAADARSTKLRSQVIAAFGGKSPVHSVLQAITLQEAAE